MATDKIKRRIRGRSRGSVMTPRDFLDLASRAAVDQALSRLTDQGMIRRLGRGLYDYPKISKRLGALSPDPDAVAAALARRDQRKVQVSPARAANMLGLTQQVPAQLVYLTDGPSLTRQIGQQTIVMRKAAAKNLAGAGKPTGLVFQALRYLGKDGVDDVAIGKLSRAIDANTRANLVRDSVQAPGWMQPIVSQIAQAA
jgi:predicted transcriptional regulator of viral defense system